LEHFEGIETYSVKHLPIVKAYADRLGLVELINHLVPSEMDLARGVYSLGNGTGYLIPVETLCIDWSNFSRTKTLNYCLTPH
jgi:hypothetical protein